ncbi:hypothetical protein [Denitromonas iodatirespirans]|uniref:Uncharacterized protein n=1 Tax=Denitromonas iodatirespirans TaxID=2795389 RepID=A0A944D695_DENI1|nr:hypothetical protein [Denitromonas iodatirespirans]MBT0960704.1 hypothetical protein [Denitromonas iodatirespirans]
MNETPLLDFVALYPAPRPARPLLHIRPLNHVVPGLADARGDLDAEGVEPLAAAVEHGGAAGHGAVEGRVDDRQAGVGEELARGDHFATLPAIE